MKNLLNFKTVIKAAWYISLSLSTLAIVNCNTEENIDYEESNINAFESTNSSFTTPRDGRIYKIRNRNSGRHMNIKSKSNANGANLLQWGTNVTSSQTHRHFQVLDVGNGYVRIKGVDSGKSLEVKDGSNSNGANVEQRSYSNDSHQEWEILPTSDGYFRIKGRDSGKSMAVKDASTSNGANIETSSWNGADRFQWFFTEVGSSGDEDDENNVGGGSGSAAAIIGGMNSDWKLNAFSGSLNIGSGSYGEDGANGLDYEDRASTGDNNNWFFDTNGYASFKCHVGNPSSNGSGNMRSELRELDGSGDEIEWDGTTNTNHRMRYKVQIRQLPSSGIVCFGQIHGTGDFDDVIRIQLEDFDADRGDNSGAGSGTHNLVVKGYVTEVLDRDNRFKSWATMQMDREYDIEIAMRNEVVTVRLDGKVVYTSKKVDSDENYFKAGTYLQSAQEDKDPQLRRNINNFGEVWIKDLSVSH